MGGSAGEGPLVTPFRCQGCGDGLRIVGGGHGICCAVCGWRAGGSDSIFNFVTDRTKLGESTYYDTEYADAPAVAPRSITSLRQLWVGNPYAPYNEALWHRLENLKGKTVVVLGSGAAPRELYFIESKPAWLVISDLSKAPMQALRDTYLPDRPENVNFAAIDAEDLPFSDDSVDVVYGYLFVHHLPDLERFLAEAARVLRSGGRAVFLDNAYAPLWEGSKRSWLRWLMRVAHIVNPISPEDLRFTLGGAFRVDHLEEQIRAVGGVPWFERSGTVHYLAVRASEILARPWRRLSLGRREWIRQGVGDPPYKLVWRHRRLLEALHRVDVALTTRLGFVRRNQVRLAWGFDMPAPRASPAHSNSSTADVGRARDSGRR